MKNIYGIWDKTAKEWNGVFLANNDEHAIQGIENSMVKKLPMKREIENLELYKLHELSNPERMQGNEETITFDEIWERAEEHVKKNILN